MAVLIDQAEGRIIVDFSQFTVLDKDAMPGQPEGSISRFDAAERLSSESWLITTANFAVIRSTYPFHRVHITLELWDEEPLRDEKWIKSKDATMFASSGVVYAVGDIGKATDKLDLRARGEEWNVRVNVRLLGGPSGESALPDDVEEYLVQFWRS